jgi:transposase
MGCVPEAALQEREGFDIEETWEDVSTYCEAEVLRKDFEEFIRRLREGPTLHPPHAAKMLVREEAKRRTPKLVARPISKDPQELSDRDRRYLRAPSEASPEIAETYRLAQEFAAMVGKQSSEELEVWIEETLTVGPDALQDFAEGLGEDEAAVRAALTEERSNGQVEGQINRLKMLKRQMYGRANFDLLRARVLAS